SLSWGGWEGPGRRRRLPWLRHSLLFLFLPFHSHSWGVRGVPAAALGRTRKMVAAQALCTGAVTRRSTVDLLHFLFGGGCRAELQERAGLGFGQLLDAAQAAADGALADTH